MRNRALVVASALLIALVVVIGSMTVSACEKKTAGESEKQTSANEDRQTGTDAGQQPQANPGTQPPANEQEQTAQAPTGAEQQPPAAGETQPSAGSEEQPPATGETETSAGTEQPPGGEHAVPETPGEAAPPAAAAGNFKYVGVAACSICHKGAAKGSIHEVWLASAHAKAYENLGAENQKNTICLACHTTGYGKALAANVTPEKMLNVQCEACHGPGSDYKALAIMKSRPAALEKGLLLPTKQVCLGCHGGKFPEGHPTVAFNYESALLKIEHHSKPTEPTK